MYCQNCGKEVKDLKVFCHCGYHPLSEKKFCQSCGTPCQLNQVVCVECKAELKYLEQKANVIQDEVKINHNKHIMRKSVKNLFLGWIYLNLIPFVAFSIYLLKYYFVEYNVPFLAEILFILGVIMYIVILITAYIQLDREKFELSRKIFTIYYFILLISSSILFYVLTKNSLNEYLIIPLMIPVIPSVIALSFYHKQVNVTALLFINGFLSIFTSFFDYFSVKTTIYNNGGYKNNSYYYDISLINQNNGIYYVSFLLICFILPIFIYFIVKNQVKKYKSIKLFTLLGLLMTIITLLIQINNLNSNFNFNNMNVIVNHTYFAFTTHIALVLTSVLTILLSKPIHQRITKEEVTEKKQDDIKIPVISSVNKSTGLSTNDKYDLLIKLKALLDQEILTEEEFKSEKTKILNQ